jgi:predicted nucleic acid-binding protein
MDQQNIVIDANIFLEFLLKQERATESVQRMRAVERGSVVAFVTSFSLHTIEVILHRHKKHQLLADFLQRVRNAQGLTVYQTTTDEERTIALLAPQVGLDFDDALQYHVAKILSVPLVSYDRDFDPTDLKRLEPYHIV